MDDTRPDTNDPAQLAGLLQNYRSAVGIPIWQALARAATAAVFVALVVALGALVASFPKSLLAWGIGAFGVTFGGVLVWFVWWGIAAWNDDLGRMIHLIERVIIADLDGDGTIGDPTPRRVVRAEIVHKTETGAVKRTQLVDMPVSEDQLYLMAAKTKMWGWRIKVRQLTEGPEKIFTQGELDGLLAVLIDRELAERVNPAYPNMGYVWTDAGVVLMTNVLAAALPQEATRAE